ncbi:MAG TPA: hypothetical protein VFM44_08720 [Gemmatimonadota bacterium]|nr:hypothetical protein [Gemmatimonadota bacterium]
MPITQLPHRPPAPRLRAVAVLTALLFHLGAVLFLPFPVSRPREGVVALIVPTDPEDMPPPLVAAAGRDLPVAVPGGASLASGSDGAAPGMVGRIAPPALAGAIPFLPGPAAAPATEAPAGAMGEARAATLPLVVRPGGGLGGRRLGRTPEQLAIARAESLLVSRLAGIAVVERRDTGAVGLANGGVTIAIPWPGFLPANRSDEKWRAERCSGGGDGDSDKAGEGEARRAQCD